MSDMSYIQTKIVCNFWTSRITSHWNSWISIDWKQIKLHIWYLSRHNLILKMDELREDRMVKLVSPWYLNTQIIMFNISIPVHTYRDVITSNEEFTAPWQALPKAHRLVKVWIRATYLHMHRFWIDIFQRRQGTRFFFEKVKLCHCFLLLPKQSLPGWLTSPRCW